jgi:hypothetical protein
LKRHQHLQIVIPIYNDWESARQLIPLIDEQLRRADIHADVLIADDGSTMAPAVPWSRTATNIRAIRILKLKRNLGHQRAICVALCFLYDKSDCERILVMDGDGQDAPGDIPRLLRKLDDERDARIVFAERSKRSEGWLFSFSYALYRFFHRLLVGHRVRVGNFSAMNRECLESLCTAPELWNHYAASAFATRQPMSFVPTQRAERISGRSSMDFPALVMHGLSALSVFSDRISTRLLIAAAVTIVLIVAAMAMVAGIRLTTDYAIPGWATMAFGALTLLLVQVGTFIFGFCFLVLVARSLSPFLPLRDYRHFVQRIEDVADERGG